MNKSWMNNTAPNDPVDRVLAGLRDIEAPEGMDRRILRAMHAHTAANTRPRRNTSRLSPKFWLAATASAAIAIAIGWTASENHRPTRDLPTSTATSAKPNTTPTPRHISDDTSITPPPERKSTQPVARKPTGEAGPESIPDTLAASHPAPPLPLTEQERLLLRILHKGDPIELASLSNDFRGRQLTEDTEAFQQFFKPPSAPHTDEALPTIGDQPAQQNQRDIETPPTADASADGAQPQ